ncbi:MAG: ribosome maturation factor RimP [Candidatus Izemoplasmatales bacterium]|nr:ribosome maturation factor RimP [Candidatus Izemoplasmatales bacterium]
MDFSSLKVKIKPVIEELGFALYDVEYAKEGKLEILRIIIDNANGISIDDCVLVSEKLSPLLDELDPIKGEYQLEVTSPGAERLLRNEAEVKDAVGKYIHLETYEQKLDGTLSAFDGETLTVRLARNKETKIDYIDVNVIRLAIKF